MQPSDSGRERIRERAAEIERTDSKLRAGTEPGAAPGLDNGPGLVLHDISPTRPATVAGPSVLEYRGLLLAGDDDEVAIGAHRSPAFEARARDLLRLSGAPVHRVERASGGNLAAAALRDRGLVRRSVARAREAGSFTVRPYIASEAVWELAREIGSRADLTVSVAGPPAVLTDRVNDKLWFTDQVSAILGSAATPPTAPAKDLDALIERLRELGGPRDRVAVRLRSAAAGEGNLVIPKAALAESRPDALEAMLRQLFSALDWEDIFPLQVAVWETPVLASPSVQTWIPRPGRAPVVEGLMEQWFEGTGSSFTGAVPSALPDAVQESLAREAALLATLFQELGYLGRCSFDAILVGDGPESAAIHWVECNGRWGGASVPMTAAERLVGDWRDRPFVTLSLERPTDRRVPAGDALDTLDELAFRGDAGVVLLSPTALETGQGLNLMAIARTRERATTLADSARDRLLGA